MKRLFPCPYYDTEATERWLEAMAAKGLILQKNTVTFGLASFEKAGPQAIRYKVVPAPHEEEVIHEPEGWVYITSRSGDKDYQIFASSDPAAPEPPVRAVSLDAALKRSTTLFGIMAILVVSMVYDDWQQLALNGSVLALDAALVGLVLERAIALSLLNRAQKGQRSKAAKTLYFASLALRLFVAVCVVVWAVMYFIFR